MEAAPDIMLLTMAALMVAIVWLVSHAQETTLPAIDLPGGVAGLGTLDAAELHVTLRPSLGSESGGLGPESEGEGVDVYIEDTALSGGLPALEAALIASGASAVTLRADRVTSWDHVLAAMRAAAAAGMSIAVAAER